jgi:hypothetical protein
VSAKDIVLSVIIPLVIAELGPWCGWLARKLLPRAAQIRYSKGGRASIRAEEWCNDLDQIPGQLSKLVYSLGQLTMGCAAAARREIKAPRGDRPSWQVMIVSRLLPWRLPSWASLFPEGRDIAYEGDDPAGFASQIRIEFGFDPASDPRWGAHIDTETDSWDSYWFYCPVEHLDAIYGSDRFLVGS